MARQFSADRDSSPSLVERAIQESKATKKRVRELLDIAMTAEGAELLAAAEEKRGFKVVPRIFEGRDLEEIRVLAAKIVQREPSIALLATKEAGAARLVFARSATVGSDMGQLLSKACTSLGGRGGGKPELAQGGGPNIEKLEEALKEAVDAI